MTCIPSMESATARGAGTGLFARWRHLCPLSTNPANSPIRLAKFPSLLHNYDHEFVTFHSYKYKNNCYCSLYIAIKKKKKKKERENISLNYHNYRNNIRNVKKKNYKQKCKN